MHEEIKQESFRQLLGDSGVVAFAQMVLTESYVECTPGRGNAMRELLQRAFAMLSDARNDDSLFQVTVSYLVREVFKKDDPQFWFNQIYNNYRRQIKPERRVRNLSSWILGNRILDLGSGDGLTGQMLRNLGYQVGLADVLDYRDDMAKDLPFTLLRNPHELPYPDRSFDTAVLFAVLHHVAAQDLLPLLDELRRVSHRLVVEEDCYAVPDNIEGLDLVLRDDRHLRAFMSMAPADQLRYLMFVDYFSNAITQGLTEMSVPFNFRTVQEWQALFLERGFEVRKILVRGFQKGFFNRSCHVWYVLDRRIT